MDPRWRFIILSLLLSPPRVANGCTLDETCVTSGSPFLLFSYSLPWVVLSHVRNLRSMVTSLPRSDPSDIPSAPSDGRLACVLCCVWKVICRQLLLTKVPRQSSLTLQLSTFIGEAIFVLDNWSPFFF